MIIYNLNLGPYGGPSVENCRQENSMMNIFLRADIMKIMEYVFGKYVLYRFKMKRGTVLGWPGLAFYEFVFDITARCVHYF